MLVQSGGAAAAMVTNASSARHRNGVFKFCCPLDELRGPVVGCSLWHQHLQLQLQLMEAAMFEEAVPAPLKDAAMFKDAAPASLKGAVTLNETATLKEDAGFINT